MAALPSASLLGGADSVADRMRPLLNPWMAARRGLPVAGGAAFGYGAAFFNLFLLKPVMPARSGLPAMDGGAVADLSREGASVCLRPSFLKPVIPARRGLALGAALGAAGAASACWSAFLLNPDMDDSKAFGAAGRAGAGDTCGDPVGDLNFATAAADGDGDAATCGLFGAMGDVRLDAWALRRATTTTEERVAGEDFSAGMKLSPLVRRLISSASRD